jgi:hypothetical protein
MNFKGQRLAFDQLKKLQSAAIEKINNPAKHIVQAFSI